MDSELIEKLLIWGPQAYTILSIVVRLTPTERDNELLDGVLRVMEVIVLKRKA